MTVNRLTLAHPAVLAASSSKHSVDVTRLLIGHTSQPNSTSCRLTLPPSLRQAKPGLTPSLRHVHPAPDGRPLPQHVEPPSHLRRLSQQLRSVLRVAGDPGKEKHVGDRVFARDKRSPLETPIEDVKQPLALLRVALDRVGNLLGGETSE